MKKLEGQLTGTGLRFALVCSRFNEIFTKKLEEGALDGLARHGVSNSDITVAWVPGAYELPLIAQKLAGSGQYDAVLALGVVIRGATPHFDYISAEVSKGVAQASLSTGVPVIFGVLTTNSIQEAIERSGSKSGNKGFDAAMSGIEMANLIKALAKA